MFIEIHLVRRCSPDNLYLRASDTGWVTAPGTFAEKAATATTEAMSKTSRARATIVGPRCECLFLRGERKASRLGDSASSSFFG